MTNELKFKIVKDETQLDGNVINVLASTFHEELQSISRKAFDNTEQRNKNIPKTLVEKVKLCFEEGAKNIGYQLSPDRNNKRNIDRKIRLAIAQYFNNNEAYLELSAERIISNSENEMEWSPSQHNEAVNSSSISMEDLESLKKELRETQAREEYWKERCQKAEKEVESIKKLRSGVKSRQNKAEKIGSELIGIFERIERNAISPVMTQLIISLITKAQQSTRQVEKIIELLLERLPSLNASLKPSQSSISRAINLLPNINLIQAVKFLDSSAFLSLAFDETTKFGAQIIATLLINENQESFVISATQAIDKSAPAIAADIMREFAQIAVVAKENDLIQAEPFEWLQQQQKKVKAILSDSCNVAKRTRELIQEELNQEIANPDHLIDLIDCTMHCVSNSESKMKKSLRAPAASALKIVSEVLAHNFSRLRADWNNTQPQRFISEVGSRFEQSSKNALMLLESWDSLIEFASLRPDKPKMVDLHHLLSTSSEAIKADLLAFTSTWFLLVSPTWNKLKTADGHESILLIDDLKQRMNSIIDGSRRASIIREVGMAKDTAIGVFLIEMLRFESTALNDALKRCNEVALKYFKKVTDSWSMDDFSEETLVMPFTNQRVESFFSILDRIAKITPGSNVATRLELGRARWNDVSKFMKACSPAVMKKIMKTRSSGANQMRARQQQVKDLLFQKTRANEIMRSDYLESIRQMSINLQLPAEKTDEAFRMALRASGLPLKEYVNAALYKVKQEKTERIRNFGYCGNVIGRLTIVAAKDLLLSLL